MRYLFDPQTLQEIVRLHRSLPLEAQIEAISATLRDVYGEHVTPGQPWMWSTAGGIMAAISPLHVSLNEYLLFCGTAIGSEGHSGRHRADIYDVVLTGELSTYRPGMTTRSVHLPGELACLERGASNGSRLHPDTWLLEYARGNVPSLFPFALGDTLFSTLDTTDLFGQISVSGKLMWNELKLWWNERRGEPFAPNLSVLKNRPRKLERRPATNGRLN